MQYRNNSLTKEIVIKATGLGVSATNTNNSTYFNAAGLGGDFRLWVEGKLDEEEKEHLEEKYGSMAYGKFVDLIKDLVAKKKAKAAKAKAAVEAEAGPSKTRKYHSRSESESVTSSDDGERKKKKKRERERSKANKKGKNKEITESNMDDF